MLPNKGTPSSHARTDILLVAVCFVLLWAPERGTGETQHQPSPLPPPPPAGQSPIQLQSIVTNVPPSPPLFLDNFFQREVFHNETFVVNCSEWPCTGDLAPIYCHGPLVWASWFFGLNGVCPGEKLKHEPGVVVFNFGRFSPLQKSSIFIKFL